MLTLPGLAQVLREQQGPGGVLMPNVYTTSCCRHLLRLYTSL